MIISQLGPNDMQRAKEMWRRCFDDSEGFVDWWFAHRYAPERALGAMVDGHYAAMLHTPEYSMTLQGARFRAACVAGVSTLPEHQGRGIGGALLQQAVLQMEARGVQLAFLYPTVSARIYRRVGFETAWARQRYELTAAQLAPIFAHAERLPIRPLAEDEAGTLAICYARAMAGKTGYVERDAGAFALKHSETQHDGGFSEVLVQDGEIRSYALYKVTGDRVDIEELCYQDARSRDAMIAALLTRHKAGSLSLYLPADDPLWMSLDDSSATASIGTGGMLRVIDAGALLGALPRGSLRAPVSLALRDSLLEKNCATFRLAPGEPIAKTDALPDMRMEIRTLAQLATGILTPLLAQQSGLIDGDAEAAQQLFPRQNAVLLDFY